MAKTARFHIATQHGYVDGTFTKTEVRKVLAEIVRDAAKSCRQRFKRCSVVGTVRSGSVKILVGGRQGANLWQRYVVNRDG